MCIKIIAALYCLTTSNILESKVNELISFTILAPFCNASLATFDFDVSIEINDSGFNLMISSITGITLLISSSSLIGSAPGLVDSPPTSRISAPLSNNLIPCSTAFSFLKYFPPSENESGVTFRIPTVYARSKEKLFFPIWIERLS